MIGNFFERIAVVVFCLGLLAFSLGFPTLAFAIVIAAALLSPN